MNCKLFPLYSRDKYRMPKVIHFNVYSFFFFFVCEF